MKKITAVTIIAFLLLSFVSCKSNTNKKIIPETSLPNVEEKNQNPAPTEKSNDEKINEKVNQDIKDVPQQNKEVTDISKQNNKVTDTGDIPSNISNEKIVYWMPGRNKEHKVPELNTKYKNLLEKYEGYFVGNTSSKVIYLTFDEGYENGYTEKILDILKTNNVKAAFFVTKPYIKSNQTLVKRMVQEGHIVGNHSDTHPSMPDALSKKGIDGVKLELTNTADYFKEVTGTEMPKFFRPPMGEWSEKTLFITNALGYKTVLWSMAHMDWDRDNQPGKAAAYKFVDTYYHNGAILLLHAVSKSNTEALDEIIRNLQDKGYRFTPLTELK